MADVLLILARAAQAVEVDLYARWLPDTALSVELAQAGIRLNAHPLADVAAASIVAEQRRVQWTAA